VLAAKSLQFRVKDVRSSVYRVTDCGAAGFRVQGSGFRVQGSGFKGLRTRVQGSGFRVQG